MILIESANLLLIDNPEIVNKNIQVHENFQIENWEAVILEPIDDEIIENEDTDDTEIKPSILSAMESVKILSDYALHNYLDSATELITKL